jgi:hypothetical protein
MRREKHVENIKWVAKLSNDTSVSESDSKWDDVKDKIIWLAFSEDDKIIIELPTYQKKYFQGKTGSCGIQGGEIQIENRCIGFETQSGDIVKVRVSKDGGMNIETYSK